MRSGIFHDNQLRPYSSKIPIGKVSQTKVNFTEIGVLSGMTKDMASLSVSRVLSNAAHRARRGERVFLDIPHVGMMVIRNKVVGVHFHDFLISDTKTILTKSLADRS